MLSHPTPSPDPSPHHTPSPANTSVNIKDILRKPWHHTWRFWFKEASKDGKHNEEESGNFLSSFSSRGYINSLQEFMSCWSSFEDPTSQYADFYIFRDGLTPTWEDPGNKDGGRLVIPVTDHSNHTSTLRIWMQLVITVFSENWDNAFTICGIGMSIREWGDFITMWNTDTSTKARLKILKTEIRPMVKGVHVGYVPHKEKLEAMNKTKRSNTPA